MFGGIALLAIMHGPRGVVDLISSASLAIIHGPRGGGLDLINSDVYK